MAIYYGPSASYYDGSSSEKAAVSAVAIKQAKPDSPNGIYWINLPTAGPTQTFCIMDDDWDGGGWMMALKATRGTTFSYTSNYWTTANTLNPTALNLDDGDAKYNVMNYFQAKDIAARFPDTSNGGTLGSSLGGWTWHENSFYNSTRTTLINFFNTVTDYYVRADDAVTAWPGHANAGPFSAQGGWRRYGFNIATGGREARWGFSWNNELTPGSNDVDSGIGMGNRVFYSCGDYITCCQTYGGVNRSMRVEILVR
jgi:hypothetical protein